MPTIHRTRPRYRGHLSHREKWYIKTKQTAAEAEAEIEEEIKVSVSEESETEEEA